jgi:hypothetical protein
MPRNGELIFAVAIVDVPMARLRLFAPLRRRFACWRPGHRSIIPFPLARSLCWKNWDSGICDSHHVLEPLPLNKSLSLDRFGQQQDRAFQILTRELVNDQTLVAFSNVRFWA